MKRIRFKRNILLAGVLAMLGMTFSNSIWAHDESINLGSLQAIPQDDNPEMESYGRVMILRGDDETSAYIQAIGLEADTDYDAHVHNLPCNLGGGGHYKNDPNVSEAEEDNEIWLGFTSNTDGHGLGEGTGDFLARPEAQSIVVHAPGGNRIACADLKQNYQGATVHKGAMENNVDGSIFGTAQINRSNKSTYATLNVMGLAPNMEYPSHVHNLPCSINAGGSHYKFDPNVPDTVEENELWLTITTDDEGNGSSSNTVNTHSVRREAQSVVVHHPDPADGRLGCADLYAEESEKVKTQGTPITTAAGLSRDYDLTGEAKMKRNADGDTEVEVEVEGLGADRIYPTHVHNLPCKLGGGGHYKIDPAITSTEESNEIWPIIETNRKGKGKGKIGVYHIARPEAQSVVIHDPSDGDRIACFDLD